MWGWCGKGVGNGFLVFSLGVLVRDYRRTG